MLIKNFIALTILAYVALSNQNVPGGYNKLPSEDLANLRNYEIFKGLELKARQEFESNHNFKLGDLIEVSQQVVSGINYKMIFQSAKGQFQIILYHQPWTQTVKVTSIQQVEQIL